MENASTDENNIVDDTDKSVQKKAKVDDRGDKTTSKVEDGDDKTTSNVEEVKSNNDLKEKTTTDSTKDNDSTSTNDKKEAVVVTEEGNGEEDLGNEINFIVAFSKEKYDIKFYENKTILQLKKHLESLIGVPQGLQKIMFKGLAKNEMTLKKLGIINGTKLMLVGSKLTDVLNVSTAPSAQEQEKLQQEEKTKEPFSKQKIHRKVLDKGVPDDAMPGILNTKEHLPPYPLSGMLNKSGGKLRITFKLELDELWLGTKERTEKIRMSSIKNIVSEPIDEKPEYHIMALQLGTTDASRYWIYFVPAQYVDSIRNTILGS